MRLREHRSEVESKTTRAFTRSQRTASLTEHKSALTDHATHKNHMIHWLQWSIENQTGLRGGSKKQCTKLRIRKKVNEPWIETRAIILLSPVAAKPDWVTGGHVNNWVNCLLYFVSNYFLEYNTSSRQADITWKFRMTTLTDKTLTACLFADLFQPFSDIDIHVIGFVGIPKFVSTPFKYIIRSFKDVSAYGVLVCHNVDNMPLSQTANQHKP